jgi:cytochrome c oxidase assembly protein subunit 15
VCRRQLPVLLPNEELEPTERTTSPKNAKYEQVPVNVPANPSLYSPWAHRLATALVCATFPLIWLGGLVTSADAGMAVPDWPTTFGYNMFLYPWESWIYGSRPILFEHGHRLLGSLVGMITLALAFVLWRSRVDRRLFFLGLGAIPLVILQGVLGGMRVVLSEQLLAMVHGCVGPAFFAYAVMLWQLTSRRFVEAQRPSTVDAGLVLLTRLAWITTILCYAQLVLGALVRHTQHMPETTTSQFRGFVHFHLFMAAVLTLHVVLLVVRAWRTSRHVAGVGFRVPAMVLALAILAQLALGAGTWVVQFGFPQFVDPALAPADFVVRSQSFAQLAITTAHVAVGSLILVTSLVLAMRSSLASRRASVGTGVAAGVAVVAAGLGLREAAAL